LAKTPLEFGKQFQLGDTTVTMVCGFEQPPSDWEVRNESEFNNAGSIVVHVQFKGKSVLFCGDAVGRHIGDPSNALVATEKFMVERVATVPIAANVVIAPHHGADNGSSTAFISAVRPQKVIFSAGHRFDHPRNVTAQRYLATGLAVADLFRTDRGDNEGGDEWGPMGSSADKRGDDDVDILVTSDGKLQVAYRN
jgi:beta-lactamase superfamily II metal-dependent hydrolase